MHVHLLLHHFTLKKGGFNLHIICICMYFTPPDKDFTLCPCVLPWWAAAVRIKLDSFMHQLRFAFFVTLQTSRALFVSRACSPFARPCRGTVTPASGCFNAINPLIYFNPRSWSTAPVLMMLLYSTERRGAGLRHRGYRKYTFNWI